MAGPNDSSITAFFGGDVSGLEKAVDRATTVVGSFQSALGRIGITIGTAAVIGFFKSVIDKASEINDLSESLGVGTDALQSFTYALRLAGGDAQDAGLVLRTTRKSVDELAEGNEKTAQSFAKLGLSQKDLLGIPLEEALEKVAKGYAANKNEAGAYAAMIDIVGSKSAKTLGVLQDMATNGLGGMEAAAKSAGQVIDADMIKKLDDAGDRIETFKGRLMVGASSILKAVMEYADSLGQLAAVVVNKFDGIPTVMEQSAVAAKKVEAAVTTATKAIQGQQATAKEFIAFNEAAAKQEIERLDMKGDRQAKINAMLQQAQGYVAEAAKYSVNTKESLEAITKANAIILEYDKEIAKHKKDIALSTSEEFELMNLQRRNYDALTDSERARLEILRMQKKERENENKIAEMTMTLVTDGLTPAEKEKLANLVKQNEALKGQIAARLALLGIATQEVKAVHQITVEIQAQLDKMNALSTHMSSLLGTGPDGRQLSNASDSVLQEYIRRNQESARNFRDPMWLAKNGYLNAGSVATNNLFTDTQAASFEINAQAAQRELLARQTSRSAGSFDSALRAYQGNVLNFDEIYRQLTAGNSSGDLTNQKLDDITGILANTLGRG